MTDAQIAAFVGARQGYCHENECKCPSCANIIHDGRGWCVRCAYPMDNHSLVKGADTMVCPTGEKDVV